MKRTVRRTITYKYEWWRTDGKEIKPEHVEALEETALDRINEMAVQGCTEGELLDNIHMTNDDPEDGISYRGWWSKEEKKNDQ